jgi:hypothetical protein
MFLIPELYHNQPGYDKPKVLPGSDMPSKADGSFSLEVEIEIK